MLMASITTFAQNETTYLCKSVDEFTDEVSVSISEQVLMYMDGGDMKTEGMIMMLFVDDKKGVYKPSTLYLKVFSLGCVDSGGTLDVILDNGEKFRLTNWKDFNCDGVNYFRLTKSNIDLLKSSTVKGLKYTNKRNYKSMVVKDNLESQAKEYIQTILNEVDALNNGEMTLITCPSE